LSILKPTQPKKDGINFIAIKKEKAVTLKPPLPCVYDSFLLIYECLKFLPHGSIVDLTPFLDVVPAWVCQQCGEVYFDEPEVDSIQEIIKTLEDRTEKLTAVA